MSGHDFSVNYLEQRNSGECKKGPILGNGSGNEAVVDR